MIVYITLGTALIFGIIFYLSQNYFKSRTEVANQQPDPKQYGELRNMALTVTAEQLELKNISDDKVYGIVTDMAMDNGTATIVAFLSGDASIYLSSGGGFIGGGTHSDINGKVKLIVDNIHKYKTKAHKITLAALPNQDEINFNFLTQKGLYQIIESKDKIMSEDSEYAELYKEIDKIITLIRLKSEQ